MADDPTVARDALKLAAARVVHSATEADRAAAIVDLACAAETYGGAIYYADEDVSSGDVYASIAVATILGATAI